MSTIKELYSELRPDVQHLAEHLIRLSEHFLRKQGNFLPHAAVLTEEGDVQLSGAVPDPHSELTNSIEVLPLLHDGLRQRSHETRLKAIAVAENVTVTRDGEAPTQAIKVLCEHRRGLCVAIYLPFKKRFLLGYTFGETFIVSAEPEVKAWTQ